MVGSAGRTARGAGDTMLETLKQNPVSNRIQGLVGTYFGGQGESFRLAPGQRVILRATRRVSEGISGGPSQSGLFGIGAVGSLLAVGTALGAAWFARRRQAERNRPINRLRRTASEIGTELGTRVPRGEEIVQYLPDREVAAEVARGAAGRLAGRGRGLTLVALGMLVGWALRGRRLRTTQVTTTSELRRGDVAVARRTDVRTTAEPWEDVTPP